MPTPEVSLFPLPPSPSASCCNAPGVLYQTGWSYLIVDNMFCPACSGNAKMEPGAVCSRVSPSFIRFGSFQLPASRGGLEVDLVPLLADYVIRHHYPHLQGEGLAVDPHI